MKTFIVRLFIILLFVCGYLSDDWWLGMFSHIVNGFVFSFIGYIIVGVICYMLDEDGELFPWVAGILNVLLILDVYIFLLLE